MMLTLLVGPVEGIAWVVPFSTTGESDDIGSLERLLQEKKKKENNYGPNHEIDINNTVKTCETE